MITVERPHRFEPVLRINRMEGLALRVQQLRARMSVSMICEEMNLPRDTVLMLLNFQRR